MQDKIPFFKAGTKVNLKILLTACATAVLFSFGMWIVLNIYGPPDHFSLKVQTLMAAFGFCIGMGMYDAKYTWLRSSGAAIGFVSGLITSISIGGSTPMEMLALGVIFALLAYFAVNTPYYGGIG